MNYTIQSGDHFDHASYPYVVDEIDTIREKMAVIESDVKGDMVIAFFKDHRLLQQWITENKDLTNVLIGSSVRGRNIEALFISCREQKTFLAEFENYITFQLK